MGTHAAQEIGHARDHLGTLRAVDHGAYHSVR
jgi:hypothetical protein